jgi:protein-disulfide isomerase-like protein with CxxC motif
MPATTFSLSDPELDRLRDALLDRAAAEMNSEPAFRAVMDAVKLLDQARTESFRRRFDHMKAMAAKKGIES